MLDIQLVSSTLPDTHFVLCKNNIETSTSSSASFPYRHFTDAKRGQERMRHDQAVQRVISDFVDFYLLTQSTAFSSVGEIATINIAL